MVMVMVIFKFIVVMIMITVAMVHILMSMIMIVMIMLFMVMIVMIMLFMVMIFMIMLLMVMIVMIVLFMVMTVVILMLMEMIVMIMLLMVLVRKIIIAMFWMKVLIRILARIITKVEAWSVLLSLPKLLDAAVVMTAVVGMVEAATAPVTVIVSAGALHDRHQGEPERNSQDACETGHVVLGQLLPGQHLEERDVQQRTPGQTLENPYSKKMPATWILNLKGYNQTYKNPHR